MTRIFVVSSAIAILVQPAPAEITNYGHDDQEAWFSDVGEWSTIDFTGYPDNTPVEDQWAYLGAHFVETPDVIEGPNEGFPLDLWGIQGFAEIIIEFDQPMTSIAMHFPGLVEIELYRDGEFLGVSDLFGDFGGVISDVPFDRVVLDDPLDAHVFADNIYFGPPIPAPGVLAVLVMAASNSRRRRR